MFLFIKFNFIFISKFQYLKIEFLITILLFTIDRSMNLSVHCQYFVLISCSYFFIFEKFASNITFGPTPKSLSLSNTDSTNF